MAAVVVLCEQNGAVPVETQDISNVNMGSTDAANLDPDTDPITAQADGHAYEKWLRLYVSDLAGSSQIDNLKIWLSGLGGGWQTEESWSTNLVTVGYAAAEYPGGGPIATDSADATEAMPEAEPGSANLGIGEALDGVIDEAPAYSDWCVLQMNVTENTEAGPVNQKTLTIQYDEM